MSEFELRRRLKELPREREPGVDLWPGAPMPAVAPWAGVVDAVTADSVTLTGTAGSLQVRGALRVNDRLQPGQNVAAGTALGTVDGHVWIQCLRRPDVTVPDFVRAEYAAGWLSLVEDPSGSPRS